ncbi:MAG: YbgC/FadM family acyl-CoA thioesterase [Hyphomicrobiaceae bacterium]
MTDRIRSDLSGRLIECMDGPRHVLPVRVYFEDTDFSGFVYHASYLRWCERGRSDLLRLLGNDHSRPIQGGAGHAPAAFVVRRMKLEYLKPARIDDVLEVETRVKDIGAASLVLLQTISRANTPLFEAEVLVVPVGTAGTPLRLSKVLRSALGDKRESKR